MRDDVIRLARQSPLVRQALEELQALMEEMQVAREELRQKNEEILAAHQIIDRERQRYQDLFEFAPDGYLVTDEHGTIIEANRAALMLLNLQPETLIGKSIQVFVALEDRKNFRQNLLSLLGRINEGQAVSTETWEIQLSPRDAPSFWAVLNVAPVQIAAGEGAGEHILRWMLHNITRRKQIETALQKAKDELEARVVERTVQLECANENLKAAALQLERKNQELENFASIAAHDLQEPLRKVSAFGKRLQEHSRSHLDEESADMLDRMVASSVRMQAMIESLLDFARVSTRSEPFQEVNLSKIAHDVLLDLEARINNSGGQVIVGDLPVFQGDATQLHQLLLNLVANALKFHRPEAPPVVKLWGKTQPDGKVFIGVQDNGIGIDPQFSQRIFQPFTRLYGKQEFEGNGMGLAICQKIVERHGGQIDFESEPGVGTTFRIILPGKQSTGAR